MEVSAKTGHNIKEFFRELAAVIAGGGKKAKEEAAKPTVKPVSNDAVGAAVNSNTMKLSS
jgi:hypothetical protein